MNKLRILFLATLLLKTPVIASDDCGLPDDSLPPFFASGASVVSPRYQALIFEIEFIEFIARQKFILSQWHQALQEEKSHWALQEALSSLSQAPVQTDDDYSCASPW